MNKRIIIILFTVLFMVGFMFVAAPARALLRDQTISTVAEKDTFVNSYDPSSNYGGEDYALAGAYASVYDAEAYFFFTFLDKPNNYTKAEISLYCGNLGVLIKNISICLIEEQWDEYSMNWTNKPIKGTEITFLLINQTDIYKFDVTNYIAGRNNLSICIYIKSENFVDENVVFSSREGYYSEETAPQLIWTFQENAEISITNPSASSIWLHSSMCSIQWTNIGIIKDVNIQLYKGNTLIENITQTYTENDGEYMFYVSPIGHYRGTDYRIKITDYDDPNVYDYSDYFLINWGSGLITITSPNSSDTWDANYGHYIHWETTGTIINVNIELVKGNIMKYSLNNVSNDGSHYWVCDENIELGKDWRVKIINSDNSSQYDWSDYFEIYRSVKGPSILGYNFYIIYSFVLIISALIIRKIKK